MANSRRTNRTSLTKVKQLRHHSAASILRQADTSRRQKDFSFGESKPPKDSTHACPCTRSTSIRLGSKKDTIKAFHPTLFKMNTFCIHGKLSTSNRPTIIADALTLRLLLLLLLFFVYIFVWRHIRSLGFPCRNLGNSHNCEM